jgi:hypothetical protein
LIGGHDYASQSEAAAGPGRDTRQWVSNGVVNPPQDGNPSVNFKTPLGPLVSVRLHPSDIDVSCRVASWMADEWHPFLGNEEVVVVLPQGHERGGALIVGRVYNGVDTLTTTVAGNDVTQNETSTRNTVPNYAWQVQNGWILRNPNTSAQLALTVAGDWMLNCGELHFLSLSSAQGAVLSNAKMGSYVQVSPDGPILINTGPGKAGLVIDPSSGMIFATTAASVPGAGPVGHVATVEGVVSLVAAALVAFGAVILPTPVTPAQAIAAMTAAIPLAGKTPPYGTFSQLVAAALAVPRSPDGVAQPGLGCAGFLV